MSFSVREALADDALAISQVRVQSWREAYAHLLSTEYLAALDPDEQADGWRATIQRGTARVRVAERDGAIRGFAIAGPAWEDDAPRPLVIGLIYQLASEHGSGSGRALLEAVAGLDAAYLWVAEHNPRAIAFYRRNGFEPDGVRKVDERWENLSEIRMAR